MAYITRQFVGKGFQRRDYRPDRIDVRCNPTRNDRGAGLQPELVLIATNDKTERQEIYLSQEEVASTIKDFVSFLPQAQREELAVHLLSGLSDAKLLRVLAFDLRNRKRLPKTSPDTLRREPRESEKLPELMLEDGEEDEEDLSLGDFQGIELDDDDL